MATGTAKMAKTWMLAACTFGSMHGQSPQAAPSDQTQSTPPLAFAVVSVKPAPPETYPFVPAFMRDKTARILGVQRMAAPVNMLIGFAYQMQMSEAMATFRKQPDWTKTKIYTVTARVEEEPTRAQMREMMQTMLADRFGLQIHQFTREGTVNKFVMSKPGVLGPNLKPHPPGASCSTQENSAVGTAPDPSKPPVAHCGYAWYYLPGNLMHVEMRDTTMAAAGTALASSGANGLEKYPVVDATGLTGKYDLTLEYRPASMSGPGGPEADDSAAPSLFQALQEQLGIRVENGQGTVRMFVVDHISQPTPD